MTTNEYNTADHHARIEENSDGTFSLQEYSLGEPVELVESFETREQAQNYFNRQNFTFPLVDLKKLDINVPLPVIPKADGADVYEVRFNEGQPIYPGDVLVNIAKETMGRIRIAVEVTNAGIVTYEVTGSGEGDYGWIPAEWLHKDVNASTEDAITVVENGYETLLESTSPIPNRATDPSRTTREIEICVDAIDAHRGEDAETTSYALDDLKVHVDNLSAILDPTEE